MATRAEWVMLAYRLPREPSTPRISVWRQLRRLGAVQLLDGLVTLPRDVRTQEQLEWLADEVIESGGEADVWFAFASSSGQERALQSRMAEAIAEEYRGIIAEANAALDEDGRDSRRTLGRLRRELERVVSRDYFPPPEGTRAHRAVERLASKLETVS